METWQEEKENPGSGMYGNDGQLTAEKPASQAYEKPVADTRQPAEPKRTLAERLRDGIMRAAVKLLKR